MLLFHRPLNVVRFICLEWGTNPMIESHEIILYETQPMILKHKRYHWRTKIKIKQTFASCSLEVAIESTGFVFLFFSSSPISITIDENNNNEHKKTNSLLMCSSSVSWHHCTVSLCFLGYILQSKYRDHNLNVTQVFRTVPCFDTSNKFCYFRMYVVFVLFGMFSLSFSVWVFLFLYKITVRKKCERLYLIFWRDPNKKSEIIV